jgi:predicted extracellular nuclease
LTGVVAAGPVPATVLRALPADWERFEGMRLRMAAPLTVSGTGNLGRHGELVASFDGRLFTPTEVARPGAAARAMAAANARRTLLLDDGRTDQARADQGDGAWYLPTPTLRTGSIVDDASGVLDQRRGGWRLQLDAPLQPRAAQRPSPPAVGGDLRLASFNLENLFNGDGRGGGFPTPRGARTAAEWQAQQAKLVATIQALDPDIAALMELENDGFGPESTVAQLVAALGGDWRFVDAGQGPGTDEIRVGLIYRATRVAPVGAAATLVAGPFGTRSRAPLAQAFELVGVRGGPVLVVAANHFKSKGCAEATGADTDQHDGQACWNALRTASARQLQAWLAGDPTHSGSDLSVIVGDLNAYAQEDPVQALVAAGRVDALQAAHVAAPYSYVYDAQSGRLDHALLSPALARHLVGAAEWHVNADEPASSGYRAGGTGPWGGSDHDPLLLGFRLRGAHPR